MNLQEKAELCTVPPAGLYLHVPFCAHTCDFCAFYQEAPRRSEIERYLRFMDLELSLWRQETGLVETVFWGGGTPGLLMAEDLGTLGRTMLRVLSRPPQEWTIEMSPSTVKPDKLQVMADLGVTRVSMGVQSFSSATLERLGRMHSPTVVYRAFDALQQAGRFSLNLDLIFAIPGQSLAEWEADLLEAIRLQPDHISTYCLTFEEDTALWSRLQKGQVHRRSEEEEAAFYETTWALLEAHGYHQYEVSNFCRPGAECRHNVHTWQMGQWIGCGPSASSQWQDMRRTNPHSLDAWAAGLERGRMDYFDETALDDEILATDALIFGLRMNEGVDMAVLKARFINADYGKFSNLFAMLTENGLLQVIGNRLRLTNAGRLLADSIGEELLKVCPNS